MAIRHILISGILVCLLFYLGLESKAQNSGFVCSTPTLQRIADASAGRFKMIDGKYFFNSIPVIVEYNQDGIVTHLGYAFFDEEQESFMHREILLFIERYFLELNLVNGSTQQRMLSDDKVVFINGHPYDISDIISSDSFTLEERENSYYAKWSKNSVTSIDFVFPKQYDLLLGQDQTQLQKALYNQISSSKLSYDFTIDGTQLESYNDIYIKKQIKTYYINSLTDSYYAISNNGTFSPVFDRDHLVESATNLFHFPIDSNRFLSVSQSILGSDCLNYNINLAKLVSYCKERDMDVYFAVEEYTENYIKALVICNDNHLGYSHMLSVLIPTSFIDSVSVTIAAKLNAYIPTKNVKSLI